MQIFSGRDGRWSKRDLKWGRRSFFAARVRPLKQEARLLITQPGEDYPEFIPDCHEKTLRLFQGR
jgi:hypothetical protein